MSATLERRLDDVFHIGDGVGANRVGGTPEEDEACALAVGWFEEAGLEVEVDGRGNVVGRLRGRSPELPEVWTGSHLDSVPEGGRFDGALGRGRGARRRGGDRAVGADARRRGVPRRGDRLPREPLAGAERGAAGVVRRAAHRAGAGAGGRGCSARRRVLDRRDRSLLAGVRRPGGPRRDDADGRPPGRADGGGGVRARGARPRRGDRRRGGDRGPDRGQPGRGERDPGVGPGDGRRKGARPGAGRPARCRARPRGGALPDSARGDVRAGAGRPARGGRAGRGAGRGAPVRRGSRRGPAPARQASRRGCCSSEA